MTSEVQANSTTTSYITCPLCEATCGLEITTKNRQVLAIKGDERDVFSKGYLCPKGYSLKELDADPDRIKEPLIRKDNGWQKVSWQTAFDYIEENLRPLMRQYGRNAVAAYAGNPNSHNLPGLLYLPDFLKALGSRNVFSATTVDQAPKQMAVALMFGSGLSVPIPDVERTDYMLILGANPLVSNGSLMTAPGIRERLRDLQKRGGKIVVIDPVRTRTAEEASEHYFIKPGTDALLLAALANVIITENLAAPGRLVDYALGLEQLPQLVADFTPAKVAPLCRIEATVIQRLARELAAAPHAIVYARIGTCTQEFGTLASWLVDVLNFLTGNLDREGGVMFPKAAAGARNANGKSGGIGKGARFGRWKSRVSGLSEIFGELPVACLAEEIETEGVDQIRALFTFAGNPVLSTPNGKRLEQALQGLDFMVSVDFYLNETSRHANVILPPLSPLEHSHYDIAFYQLAARNVANYSPPLFKAEAGRLDEWQILLKLTAIVTEGYHNPANMDLESEIAFWDDSVIAQVVKREVATLGSALEGRAATEILAELASRRGPERVLDFLLRAGPYGDWFGQRPDGLTLAVLEAHPHGVDLGPLQPRLPELLRTASGKIELTPPLIVNDLERLRQTLERRGAIEEEEGEEGLVLIGRRDLRSNNSWLHNLNVLVKGKTRCTLLVNSSDANRLDISSGDTVEVKSRVGSVEIVVEVTDNIMPGVVSIPHGWGHDLPGMQLETAQAHAGVNVNLLVDETLVDVPSGNAVLNGVPVTIEKLKSVLLA